MQALSLLLSLPIWHLSGSLIFSLASLPPQDSQSPSSGSTSFLSSPNFSPCCLLQHHTLPASQTPQQERWAHTTPAFVILPLPAPNLAISHQFCHFHRQRSLDFASSLEPFSSSPGLSLPTWARAVCSVLVSAAALYPPPPLPPPLNS